MDFTVYLPDDLGRRLKEAQTDEHGDALKPSRLFRTAVEAELKRRDVMQQLENDARIYQFQRENDQGQPYIARFTGRLIAGTEDCGLFITADERYISTVDDAPEVISGEDAAQFLEGIKADSPDQYIEACHLLGLMPVIEL